MSKSKAVRKRDGQSPANGGTMIGRIPQPVWNLITTGVTVGVGMFMKWLRERPAKTR